MKISYSSLNEIGKHAVSQRLVLRKNIYLNALKGVCAIKDPILIVGDRPGPSAPREETYHHTPFYSIKHCSGWLNAALHIEQIPEEKLVWINSADKDGIDTDFNVIKCINPGTIIALGANARKWLNKNGVARFEYTHHPQYHKRFRNTERYDLLDKLKSITN